MSCTSQKSVRLSHSRQLIGQREMPTIPGSRWSTDSGSLRLRPLRGRCAPLVAPQSALAFAFLALHFGLTYAGFGRFITWVSCPLPCSYGMMLCSPASWGLPSYLHFWSCLLRALPASRSLALPFDLGLWLPADVGVACIGLTQSCLALPPRCGGVNLLIAR